MAVAPGKSRMVFLLYHLATSWPHKTKSCKWGGLGRGQERSGGGWENETMERRNLALQMAGIHHIPSPLAFRSPYSVYCSRRQKGLGPVLSCGAVCSGWPSRSASLGEKAQSGLCIRGLQSFGVQQRCSHHIKPHHPGHSKAASQLLADYHA